MANPLQMGLDTLQSLQTAKGRQIQQENQLLDRDIVQQQRGEQANFQDLSRQYSETKDPAILRQMIAADPQVAGQIQKQLGIADQATRSRSLSQAQAFTKMLQANPQQAKSYFEQNLAQDPVFSGLADNFAADDYEGALNEIGFGVTALGGMPAYEAIFGKSETPNIGTYNPRDYTADSFARFVKSKDPKDLVKATKYSTVTIGGVEYRQNPNTGEYDVPVIGGGEVGQGSDALTPESQREQELAAKVAEDAALAEAEKKRTEEDPETIEKKAKQDQVEQDVLTTINELKDMNVGPVTGITGRAPTFLPESENVLVKAKRLQSMLTSENMDIMSGVLSETDIKIIADLAGGFGLVTNSAGEPVRIRGSEKNFYERLDQIANIISGAKKPPKYKIGQRANNAQGDTMVYTENGWVAE